MFVPFLKSVFHETFWLERLFNWLVVSSVEVFVLVGFILAFKAVFRKRLSPQWSYYIWIFALLRLVVLFVRCMWFAPAGSFEFASNCWVLFWLWVVGLFVVAGIQIWRVGCFFAFLKRLKPVTSPATLEVLETVKEQLGVRIGVRVFATSMVSSPALVGVFRPRILIPPGMDSKFTPSEQKFIFLHELAHLKRVDLVVKWIAFVFKTLFWFHPVVWFALWRVVCECEINCDFHALAHLNEKQKFEYAQTVLKFIESLALSKRIPSLLGFGSSKSQIRQRIESIADFNPSVAAQIPHLDFVLIVFLGILVFGFPVLSWGNSDSIALKNVTNLVVGDHMSSYKSFYFINYQHVLYDYVEPGDFAGQSFCANADNIAGGTFFIGKRYEEAQESLLKGAFDLVLYEFTGNAGKVREVARKRFLLKPGVVLKGRQDFFFDRAVDVVPGKMYMLGIQSEHGFSMRIRQPYESDYPLGSMGVKNRYSDNVVFGVHKRDYLFRVFSSSKMCFDFHTLYSAQGDCFFKKPQGCGVS